MLPRFFNNGRSVYLCLCVHNTSSCPCGSCCCGGSSGKPFKYLLQKILFSVGVKQRFQIFLGHFRLSNPVGDKPDMRAPDHPCILVEINKVKLNGLIPRGENRPSGSQKVRQSRAALRVPQTNPECLVVCPVAACIKLKWCSQICRASSSATTAVTQEIILLGKHQHGGGSTAQDV